MMKLLWKAPQNAYTINLIYIKKLLAFILCVVQAVLFP
jgi:hypothetical protein